MVRKTELYIPVEQLSKVSFSCTECRATVVIDIADDTQRAKVQADIGNKCCSACGQRFERTVFEAIGDLIRWYEKAIKREEDIHFITESE